MGSLDFCAITCLENHEMTSKKLFTIQKNHFRQHYKQLQVCVLADFQHIKCWNLLESGKIKKIRNHAQKKTARILQFEK